MQILTYFFSKIFFFGIIFCHLIRFDYFLVVGRQYPCYMCIASSVVVLYPLPVGEGGIFSSSKLWLK